MARVLITGASRGIGREAVEELTARGHEVIATARDPSSLEDMPAAVWLQLDVTDESSVQAAIEAAGPIDVLVSNAGATMRAPMETVPLAEVEQLFNINTFGALRVAQAVLPGMRQSRFGKLIFVSSIQGRVAIPLIGPYAASKWALEAIAETLAIEVRHFGISVSVLPRLVHLCRDPDCDRRRGDACLADQLHRGARDRRRGMARRHGDHRSCVGIERASHSRERGAPSRGVVGAQRRQLTHRAWPRRDWTRQPHAPKGIAAVGSKVTRVRD